MQNTIEEIRNAVAVSAKNWVSPDSIKVRLCAEILCTDPDQAITRPLAPGAVEPEEGDIIYFSSQEADIPAFVCEADFEAYCRENGLQGELPSDGVFAAVAYHVKGSTFGGDEVFLGVFGCQEMVKAVCNAFTAPVQAMLDSGLIADVASI